MENSLNKLASIFLAATYWGNKASGIIYVCQEDDTILLLKRSRYVEQPGTWGVAGGAIGEGFFEAEEGTKKDPSDKVFLGSAEKEVQEELGSLPRTEKFIGETVFKDRKFTYKTFVYSISLEEKERWTPTIRLNWENDQAKWFPTDQLPGGLHFGLIYSLRNLALNKEQDVD